MPEWATGVQVGPYVLLAAIGAGGMGEVWKARDTRLDRVVAIKTSREQFSERFEREARAVAALNHPYICQLYDVGPNYLVMEFIEGAALKGPLSVEKAVEYGRQILDALDAAHSKGITHRDLKPANILVTKQGIKLLDFGLAKHSGLIAEAGDDAVTQALTQRGQIVGTLQYMSPEQLQGKETDARSDLFAFGCVLYEMLTGKRAFEGESAASVIAAILEREPAAFSVSPPLDRVLRRCLAKDPDQRFQTARDLKATLTWALEQAPASTKPPSRHPWIAAAAAALALGAIGGWEVSRLHRPSADDRIVQFQIPPPEGGGMAGGGNLGGGFAISPDGRTAAFVGVVKGKTGLWVRPIEAANARLIPGSEGAHRPFWSPDNGSIAFSVGPVLQRVDLSRQTTSKICDLPGPFWGGSWSEDGRILFATRDQGVFEVPASGGARVQLTTLDRAQGETNHVYPQVLPGGRLLFTVMTADPRYTGIYAASLAKPAGRTSLVANGSEGRYVSADGEDYLLWIRDGALMAQRFNHGTIQLLGEPHLLSTPATMASSGGRVLLYGSSIGLRQFKWVDRKGNPLGSLGEPGPWVFNRLSPDGRRLLTVRAASPPGIWLLETARGVASPVMSGPGFRLGPIWSPDGRTILYSSGLPLNIFRSIPGGASGEERVTNSSNSQRATDWSLDKRFVLYDENGPDTGLDVWVLPVTPEGKPSPDAKPWPFIRERFDQNQARFSPDTRWVAYESNESGQFEIYVRSFPDPREKIPISTSGGVTPQWGAGGRELFYQSRDGKLMVVTLRPTGTSLDPSLPRELFPLPTGLLAGTAYEAAPDGQRFLVNDAAASPDPLTVIVNWPALLKKGAAP